MIKINWELADCAEDNALTIAAEEANEEFLENFEEHLEEELLKIERQNKDDDFGKDDDFSDDESKYWETIDDGDDGGSGGGGGGGFDVLDIIMSGIEEIINTIMDIIIEAIAYPFENNIMSSVHIPTPRPASIESYNIVNLLEAIVGDTPYTRALKSTLDDVPEIRIGAFITYLEELDTELIDFFADYPEAYIETVYRDRARDGLNVLNGTWEPNMDGILPNTQGF